ncbi:conserved Plasmodium protein, unknown function [Plasmodium ovale]|uniref:Uncharacterized protein n=1 Tax=Plasmodium ovale TaxID=36330 RepID=A0A1D3TIP8_PLAOA|nr:conserved Plasmodium protein, unknown function [Plasmodium ovale]
MFRVKRGYFFYVLFIFFLLYFLRENKVFCVNRTKDYISDLLKLGIFEKSTNKIKKEIYEEINSTHHTFSSCKTCIKLIQLLNKIIKKKKEPYVDIAIEDALETKLCTPELWKEHFNYDELLYSDHILHHCEHTYKIISNSVEENIYQLYKNEEIFYEKVCGQIHHVCKAAIREEKNSRHNYQKIKFIYDLYSQYLTEEENFRRTSGGIPYKRVKTSEESNVKLEKSNYAIIQSEIKIVDQRELQNDFNNGNFRLIKINKLESKIMELFLHMREQDMFIFLSYHAFGDDSILEVKIKIHEVLDSIREVDKGRYKNRFIDNVDNFLLGEYASRGSQDVHRESDS